MILPIVILGGYWFVSAGPAEEEAGKLAERKAALGSESLIRMETSAANKKRAEAEKRLKELEAEEAESKSTENLPNRLKTLTDLCESCGCSMLSFTQDGGEKGRRYDFGSRHWNLKCEATYANMKRFLAQLAEGEGNPIAESLSVDIISNGGRRRYIWTMLLSL